MENRHTARLFEHPLQHHIPISFFQRHKKALIPLFSITCIGMIAATGWLALHEEENEKDTVDRIDQLVFGFITLFWLSIAFIGTCAFYNRHALSDEAVNARREKIPYWDYFCPKRCDQAADDEQEVLLLDEPISHEMK